MKKDVLNIVAMHLIDHGFDGLCNDTYDGCGCALPDLMPCDNSPTECLPAYNHPATAEKNKCGVWMTTRKPKARKR